MVKRKIGKVVAVIVFLAGSFTLGNEAGKLAIEREKSAVEVVRQAPLESGGYYNTGPEVIWDGKGGLDPWDSDFNFVGPGEVEVESSSGNPGGQPVEELLPALASPGVEEPEGGKDEFSGPTQLPVEKPLSQTRVEVPLQGQDTGMVVSVHDGDTFTVKLANELVKVRLLGVDTPELVNGEFGETAAAYTRMLLQGQNVTLTYDRGRFDKYGRTLAYVYLPDGTFVNAHLVEEGYARVMTISPNTAHADEFEALQDEAQQGQRGIWADPPPECTWRGEKT